MNLPAQCGIECPGTTCSEIKSQEERNLEQNRNEENGTYYGKLPEWAPLANPYVPFQMKDPQLYTPGKALIRGTVYPGLDLPLLGMVNKCEKKKTPMVLLQELGFTLNDLTLYLDTHRGDEEAYGMYCKFRKAYRDACAEYSEHHSPLTHTAAEHGKHYGWLHDPWPWEYAANRGV